jgi:hypothetical protein
MIHIALLIVSGYVVIVAGTCALSCILRVITWALGIEP